MCTQPAREARHSAGENRRELLSCREREALRGEGGSTRPPEEKRPLKEDGVAEDELDPE